MRTPRSLRRLAGSAALALALAAGAAAAPASPAHAAATAALPPVGSTVCHASVVFGLQCGPIVAKNVTITFPGGTVTGLFRYRGCVSFRDRGIAVFVPSTGQPVGTVFAGSGNPSTGCDTFAQPLS